VAAGAVVLSASCIVPPVTQQQKNAAPKVASKPSAAPSYQISWHVPTLPACAADEPTPASTIDARIGETPAHDGDAGVTIAQSSTVDFAQWRGAAPTTDGEVAAGRGSDSTSTTGAVKNAARVVAGMCQPFRTCFQTALAEYRDTAGTARLTIAVGCEGSVVAVRGAADTLHEDMVRCLIDVARGRRFEPPVGGSAVIAVPVTFVRQ
jgi:hypothetical protein